MPRVSITVPGNNSQAYRFQLDRTEVTIGRSADNDITIDCPSVSSKHCTMERVEGGYILRDRNSTNGITLDEESMAIIDLRNSSDVRVGDVKFDYHLSDEELDDLDEEEFLPHAKKAGEIHEEPETKKKQRKKKKRKSNVVTTPARPAQLGQPVLASAEGVGFFYTLCLLVCGVGALCAGLNNSYANKQKIAGREGEISLFKDIKDGRPPLPKEKEEE